MTGLSASHWEQMIRPEFNRAVSLLVRRGLKKDFFYRLVGSCILHSSPTSSFRRTDKLLSLLRKRTMSTDDEWDYCVEGE